MEKAGVVDGWTNAGLSPRRQGFVFRVKSKVNIDLF